MYVKIRKLFAFEKMMLGEKTTLFEFFLLLLFIIS